MAVYAQKRAENVQNVPVSVSVIAGEPIFCASVLTPRTVGISVDAKF